MGRTYKIALMKGDGIGPEITEATLKVLSALEEISNFKLDFIEIEGGDECLRRRGIALPEESIDIIRKTGICLKGPVGESAADVIVKLRLLFDLYANLRPVKSYPGVPALRSDIDMLIVRENTEDLYKGYEFNIGDDAIALRVITKKGCKRIAEIAFKYAMLRRKKVTIVHKANVLRITDGLFRNVCLEVSKKYPEVKCEELYVDAAAMHLIRRPQDFDVIVTTNLFGDILSDEAAQICGSLGLAPGANIGDKYAIFEPIHGSAPDIAGKKIANPISMILSAKMMLEYLGEKEAGSIIENAITKVLSEGKVLTKDLGGNATTDEITNEIIKKILKS